MLPRSTPFHTMLAIGLLALAAPALANPAPASPVGAGQDPGGIDTRPVWKPAPPSAPSAAAAPLAQSGLDHAGFEAARLDWLAECRRRYGDDQGRTAGTIAGGLIGGVAGSAIAERGDRVVGAIAGGTLGAVAGSAIGTTADKRRARDYCEAYLEDYLARQQHGYGPVSHGHAFQSVIMVPVAMAPATAAAPRECTETTVIEEWVPATTRQRHIPRHRAAPDKRVRIAPDKRVNAN